MNKRELYVEYESDNKQARVMTTTEGFEVDYFNKGIATGTILYHEKSRYYVEDAAWNWCTGILTEETLDRYKVK
jgi:hypothetical protein